MFGVNLGNSLDIITTIASVITAAVAIWIYLYGRHQKRFEIMEQSFDVLQRLNEKALESDENVLAAIRSAQPGDKIGADEARIIYFHYMRINRVYRAYEYHLGGFITKKQRDRIALPQIRTFVSIAEKIPAMIQRGYPSDFLDYLAPEIERMSVPDKFKNTKEERLVPEQFDI